YIKNTIIRLRLVYLSEGLKPNQNKKASPGGLVVQYRAMTGFLMPQA
ncbi:hypothetical protein AZ044_005283, partial [Pluralibacter gergoviae]